MSRVKCLRTDDAGSLPSDYRELPNEVREGWFEERGLVPLLHGMSREQVSRNVKELLEGGL